MRVLFVIPHYLSMPAPAPSTPGAGRDAPQRLPIAALARIAALSATLSALICRFGSRRHELTGTPILNRDSADIVVVTRRDGSLLPYLDYDDAISRVVEYDGDPLDLAWHCQAVMRDLAGGYDYYCYLEDDIILHDPALLDKIAWFERTFGPGRMLLPTRYELSRAGLPAKIVIDPLLGNQLASVFRRPGQTECLEGRWRDDVISFAIPSNPHAAFYCLSAVQLEEFSRHQVFASRQRSWVGPLESAATYAIGQVFDLYKTVRPDPFFAEIEHYGTRYAGMFAPFDVRYGDDPLLALAECALRDRSRDLSPPALDALVEAARGADGLIARRAVEERAMGVLVAHRDQFAAERDRAIAALEQERAERQALERSPRAILAALIRSTAARFR